MQRAFGVDNLIEFLRAKENDMRASNDNASAKTIKQAKSELLDNVRAAIASINELTENLERIRASVNEKHHSVRQ